MQFEHHEILTVMSDGAHRSFDLIKIKAQMSTGTVGTAIRGLVEAGLLERNSAAGDERYVITLKGLIELHDDSDGPPPLYRQ
jgi:hypothetical protein